METIASNSFSLNIVVLKFLGLYPSNKYRTLHRLYGILLYILAIVPVTVLGALHFVFAEDLTSFSYNDFIVVGISCYAFKLLPFLINGDNIKKNIHYFDGPCFDPKTSEHEKIVGKCIKLCRLISKCFFMGCVCGLLGIVLQLLFRGNFQTLPLNVWIPKFVRETTYAYFTLYMLLVWGEIYSAIVCGVIDPLIGGLSHHAATQLRILKNNLQHLDRHVGETFSHHNSIFNINRSATIYSEIKECVQHYQAILNFVNEYEKCFSSVVFSQFLGSGLVIGMCCYQLSKVVDADVNFFITLNNFFNLFFQIFFYCYFGTELIEENETLATAIYMSRWYEYDTKSKKSLIVLMERSKRQLVVRAGKLFDLSLETFMMILKRAYSLLAVLKNY